MKKIWIALFALSLVSNLHAGDNDSVMHYLISQPLEVFLQMKVTTTAQTETPLSDLPATIYVLSKEDIHKYSQNDLHAFFEFVPGIEYFEPYSWLQGGQ